MFGGLESSVLAHLDESPSGQRWDDDAVFADQPLDLRKAELWAR